MNPQMIPAVMAPLMAFAVYRRVRGSFGAQPIRRKRMMGRIAVLTLVAGLCALGGLANIQLLEGLLGGIGLGVMLGLAGIRLTRFDRNAAGEDVYIPNPWIGGALTVLLLGRLAWRFVVLAPQMQDPAMASHGPPMGNSPLTFLVMGLTIGYYVCYFIGLLVHHRRFLAATAAGRITP